MTADEALREIVRAVEAWDNDEDFGVDTDDEYRFLCDADFLDYIGRVAHDGSASLPSSDLTKEDR